MFANWFEETWGNLYDNPHFWYYVAGVGGGLVVIAVLLNLLLPRLKMPAIVLSIVGSLGVGIVAGILIMGTMGYDLKKPEANANTENPQGGGDRGGRGGMRGGMMGGGGQGGGGMMGGGGQGGGMMGGGGQGGGMMGGGGQGGAGAAMMSKFQLVQLVNKLDVLSEGPLQVKLTDLTPEEVAELTKLLDELKDIDKVPPEAAKDKLEALHKLLESKKETLTKAGYNWEGRGGRGGGGGGGGMRGGMMGGGGGNLPEETKKEFKEHRDKLAERLKKPQV